MLQVNAASLLIPTMATLEPEAMADQSHTHQTAVHRFHLAEGLSFSNGTLRVRLSQLLEGEEDGSVGRPLAVLADSRCWDVVIEQVGHFQVRPEPMDAPSAQSVRVHEFLYREYDTGYLAQNAWGAENLANPRLPHGVSVAHYVVYAENFVVDVLATQEPTVTEVRRAAR